MFHLQFIGEVQMSKYTAQQIYALGQFIHANQRDFPDCHIGNQLRHLEYNAQRNLADASEDFFRKYLHTTVEKAMDRAAAVMNRKANPPQPASVQDNGAVAVRIIDLSEGSKPAPANPRAAVFVDCAICRKEIAVPESKSHEPAFCSTACVQKAQAKQTDAESELEKFMTFVGNSYYDCERNTEAMTQYLRSHSKSITSDNLLDAYLALRNSGQLLMPLSVQEMDALTSAQFAAREKIDPEMGGAIAAMNAATKTPETQHWSSNKQRFGQSFERTGVSSRVGS
jgi:hypothetical protein